MKNVLFITDSTQQYYWQPFVEACDGRAVHIYIFDTSRFPSKTAITLAMAESGQVVGSIEVKCLQSEQEKSEHLSLKNIDIAWYLRAGKPVPASVMNELEDRFTQDESRVALSTIFDALDCKWVNRMDAIERAESSKFYQQSLAVQCGLKIPRTLITNDPKPAIEFSTKTGGVLLKTLGHTHLGEDNGHFIYSQRFSTDELAGATDAIRACPIFCQRYIEKRFEYRVIAVGKEFLTCRIDSQASSATKVDWRHYDFDNVEHKQADLPEAVQGKLLDFMEAIDLRYGAIDMIETPGGEFVFLEINPAGQWQWLQHFSGLPVPDAVARMLSAL
jgi:glutathione synthase/RimK-type ligase-like ATP-grasp enzyme